MFHKSKNERTPAKPVSAAVDSVAVQRIDCTVAVEVPAIETW
jgi:hypothetical protein